MSKLNLAELIGSLSYALDLTEGQPEGHCVRCCWIGMHVGNQLGLPEDELWSLYYTLLLKDLGCSSNAARICELYLADDLAFKRDFKRVGSGGVRQMLGFVVSHTGQHSGWRQRLGAILNIVRNGDEVAQELIQTRCNRGASIARQLLFPESVAQAVHSLDEHFDGGGRPDHLRASAIPLASQIALMAQVVDVFHFSGDAEAALAELRLRAGSWFDPALVQAFEQVAREPAFWVMLASDQVERAVNRLAPASSAIEVDEEYLDAIAEAFGQVVDAKSPFTAGHSARVAHYAVKVAIELGMPPRDCAGFGVPHCCMTWASSASATRFWTSRLVWSRTNGSRFSGMLPIPDISLAASSSSVNWPRWQPRTMNGWMVPVIRWDLPPRQSARRRGSSPWLTSSMRSPPSVPTMRPPRSSARWKSCERPLARRSMRTVLQRWNAWLPPSLHTIFCGLPWLWPVSEHGRW